MSEKLKIETSPEGITLSREGRPEMVLIVDAELPALARAIQRRLNEIESLRRFPVENDGDSKS